MNKFNAFLIAALVLSASVLAGCKSESPVEQPKQNSSEFKQTQNSSELEQTQKELAKIKQNSSELDKYVVNLKKEINELKIENQRLIARTKRLEAEIIELKLDLGQMPSASSTGDMLDKDAEPAAKTDNTATDQSKSETPTEGGN